MAKVKATNSSGTSKKLRPALTPEARESRMISLATDLVEQRLIDGTASSQETTHFLKLASSKSRLEVERAKLENELIKAKTEALQSQKNLEKIYTEAIQALKGYGNYGSQDESDDEY